MKIGGVRALMLFNTMVFKIFKSDKYTQSYGTKSKLKMQILRRKPSKSVKDTLKAVTHVFFVTKSAGICTLCDMHVLPGSFVY